MNELVSRKVMRRGSRDPLGESVRILLESAFQRYGCVVQFTAEGEIPNFSSLGIVWP